MIVCLNLSLLTIIFMLFMAVRNNKVYKERLRVLNIISKLAEKNVNMGKDFAWRYDEFESIPYNKMFYEFWKPVSSYFADSDCCKE